MVEPKCTPLYFAAGEVCKKDLCSWTRTENIVLVVLKTIMFMDKNRKYCSYGT